MTVFSSYLQKPDSKTSIGNNIHHYDSVFLILIIRRLAFVFMHKLKFNLLNKIVNVNVFKCASVNQFKTCLYY